MTEKILSQINSTNFLLGANEVYNGIVEDVVKYETITITINADTNSSANGIEIYSGPSSTNLELINTYTYTANDNKVITFKSNYSYFKIVYTNSATPQTLFFLQTFYGYSTLSSGGGGLTTSNPIAIGEDAGYNSQNTLATALGYNAGYNNQGTSAIAIGTNAGKTDQGSYSICIGANTNSTFSDSVIINGGSTSLTAATVGFYANPVRNATFANTLYYDSTNKEITYGPVSGGSSSSNPIAIGESAGATNQQTLAIALGYFAGNINQATSAIAIGTYAGNTNQGTNSIAIGNGSGANTQGNNSIAIGTSAGYTNQSSSSIAIGNNAGAGDQGQFSIALGNQAGLNSQASYGIAIGSLAGAISQKNNSIALGTNAGYTNQGTSAIAIGNNAGRTNQGSYSICIGANTNNTFNNAVIINGSSTALSSATVGFYANPIRSATNTSALYYNATTKEITYSTVSSNPIAIGQQAGFLTQKTLAIALGYQAGYTNQGTSAIAIGESAGKTNQGSYSICIGAYTNNTFNNSVVINGGSILLTTATVGFYANPIRSATFANTLYYDSTNKEITYGPAPGSSSSSSNPIAIGQEAGYSTQQTLAIALGYRTGYTNQGQNALAIGSNAGMTNQGDSAIAIGRSSGSNAQLAGAIAIGQNAGNSGQDIRTIAIGYNAGNIGQVSNAIAIGNSAGQTNQGSNSIAIGQNAGRITQGFSCIALGTNSGQTNQGNYCIALGYNSGNTTQGGNAIAIGNNAGQTNQGVQGIAIGTNAGSNTQGQYSIAIGLNAANTNQSSSSIAIGYYAGSSTQGNNSIAIGSFTGSTQQSANAIAIGYNAGRNTQGELAIAIGTSAGYSSQGTNAIAIGQNAGLNNQGSYSICIGANTNNTFNNAVVINGGSSSLTSATIGFYANPIRGTATATPVMVYDSTTKELTYNTSSIKYKKNVIDLQQNTNTIYNIRAREYDAKDNDKHFVGYIAEELNEVDNYFTWKNPDGTPEGIEWFNLLIYSIEEMKKLKNKVDTKDFIILNMFGTTNDSIYNSNIEHPLLTSSSTYWNGTIPNVNTNTNGQIQSLRNSVYDPTTGFISLDNTKRYMITATINLNGLSISTSTDFEWSIKNTSSGIINNFSPNFVSMGTINNNSGMGITTTAYINNCSSITCTIKIITPQSITGSNCNIALNVVEL